MITPMFVDGNMDSIIVTEGISGHLETKAWKGRVIRGRIPES